ncbi:helix-turn-helix domain-containing protein [Vreelandella aquamarina]|uniref:helix-turn-helix domain-containing protein n=1 Tax=Vreelandella aquamarina TaxID=77097 RepID=UPI00078515C4|nr:helix-turn-helix domain-containing protein [Halomonas axialensis]
MHGTELAEKLEALLASGVTYKAIAERAGCDASTIYRIRSGAIANPLYSTGRAIDEMHAELKSRAA